MNASLDTRAELMDGLVFTIGREGHIHLDDDTVSRLHAEIKIVGGKIYLRDLNSTNGTYLILDKKHVSFQEGYVKLDTPILIGKKLSTARIFLSLIGVSSSSPQEKTIVDKTVLYDSLAVGVT